MARHETRQVMDGGAVVIPKGMRDKLGIGEGDHVEFEQQEGGEILLRRGEAPPEREGDSDSGSDGEDTGVPPNEVQKALKGIDYPAKKDDLVSHAEKNGAPDVVQTVIERFPERDYGGPQDVMKAFGEVDNRP
jgi:AbrB family looped-hinge helix DNA binding protein